MALLRQHSGSWLNASSTTLTSSLSRSASEDDRLAEAGFATTATVVTTARAPLSAAKADIRGGIGDGGRAQAGVADAIQPRAAPPAAGKPASVVRWSNLKNAVRVTNFKARKGNDVFLERFSTRRLTDEAAGKHGEDTAGAAVGERTPPDWATLATSLKSAACDVVDPDGDVIFWWLVCVTAFIIYNLWTIILREGFPAFNSWGRASWTALDAIADVVFAADIGMQLRTGYLEHGIIVTDAGRLARHYLRSKDFWLDVLSILPSDYALAVSGGGEHPIARLPRLLKVYRFLRLSHMAETRTSYPNILRVVTSVHTLFLIVHWFAAFYYMISKYERHADEWSFPFDDADSASMTRQYLVSFYWAALTLTTIGDLPGPETNWQYVFQIASYMIGLFIFATIVGQVGNVISNYTASRQDFERQLDGAKTYMQRHGVPKELQTRVQRWYDYVWTRNHMLASGDINSLQLLPDKLKTELALHVNLEILRKVTIFDDCEPEFLHDLVLKMKSCIYTPGDLIVRKSEIAREMFIVADGVLEVLSDTGEVIANLTAGNFFGEIGILNLEGGINRRTADVRSVGYSDLFVLEREAVVTAIQQYPQAKTSLMRHAQKRLQEMKKIGSDKQLSPNAVNSSRTVDLRQRESVGTDDHQARLECRDCSHRQASNLQLEEAVRQCNENIRQLRYDIESYSALVRRLSQTSVWADANGGPR